MQDQRCHGKRSEHWRNATKDRRSTARTERTTSRVVPTSTSIAFTQLDRFR